MAKLLTLVKGVLNNDYKFVLLSVYTADLSSIAVGQLVSNIFGKKTEFMELALKEYNSDRLLPNGIVCRNT